MSRQDELATRAGKMELSCPLGTTCCVLQEKFPRKSFNKSFTDQSCSVKMAGYWPHSFFASLWTETELRSLNVQKRTWSISSHLDRTSLVNNPYVLGHCGSHRLCSIFENDSKLNLTSLPTHQNLLNFLSLHSRCKIGVRTKNQWSR